MKRFLFAVALFAGILANGQETNDKLDLRFGVGTSLLGTGDMLTIMFENELNYKLNDFFGLAGSVGYAKSDNGVFHQSSFIQFNTNVYFSPFKNSGKNDFRLGTGVSWYAVSDVYQSSATYQNGQLIDSEYVFDQRQSVGFNAVIENTYSITEKYKLGIKLFTQPYQNGDMNSGALLKFGVAI